MHDSLASICLLQRSTIPDLFHHFLSIRRARILELIDDDEETIGSKLENIPWAFFETVKFASNAFVSMNQQKGKLQDYIEIINSQGLGQTSHLFSENTNFNLLVEYLPRDLKNSICDRVNLSVPLTNETVLRFCKLWADGLELPIKQRLTVAMKGIPNAEALEKNVQKGLDALELICATEIRNIETASVFFELKGSWRYFFEGAVLETSKMIVQVDMANIFKDSNIFLTQNLKIIRSISI